MNESQIDRIVGVSLVGFMAATFMYEWGLLVPFIFLGTLGLIAYWVTFEYDGE